VPLSLAFTCKIPLASISNVTSICGTPRGAGGIPVSSKLPRCLLSAAIDLSPCNTTIDTAGWLSAAVENTCDFLVGMVVLRSIIGVRTPPSVSSPSVSGVTSSSRISCTLSSPPKIPPCTAAPIATTSSGFIVWFAFLPKNFSTASRTAGIFVLPPTSRTSLISLAVIFASVSAWRHGLMLRSTK